MSILDELELRTQFEARRALGVSALGTWARTRLPLEAPSRVRAECVRGVLILSVGAGDTETVASLTPLLLDRPRVDLTALLAACETSGHSELARTVARGVVEAEPTSTSLLVLAALEEKLGRSPDAESLRRRAVTQADGLADRRAALRARIELARGLSLVGREVDALGLATEIDRESEACRAPLSLDARDQLILARVELAATGRYRRVRAIDRLAEVVAGGGFEGRAALRLLARHVERAGTSITLAEVDRAEAVVGRARATALATEALDAIETRLALARADEAEREAATVRAIAASNDGRVRVERARALRDGGTAGPAPSAPLRGEWLCLSVLAHTRTRRLGDALVALREIDATRAPASVAGWSMVGRACAERALREPLVSIASRWLADDRSRAPRRGYLDLAVRLERAGLADLASVALDRARRVHEPGARELAIQHAIRRAWSLRARGETREAHRLLAAALSDARVGAGSALMSPSPPRTR